MSTGKTKKKPIKKQSIYDEFVNGFGSKNENSKLENLLKVPKRDTKENMPHIQVGEAHYIYQVDTLYLPKDVNGEQYALVCVDLATNAVDAVAMKTRDSKTTAESLKKMFKRKHLKKKPHTLEVDDGTEFKGDFEKEMKKLNIFIRHKKPGRSRQQAAVEGMNSIIGKLLNRAMLVDEMHTNETSKSWVEHLPRAVELMNKRLTHKPKDYSNKEVRCKDDACDALVVGTKVRVMLDKPRDYATNKTLHGKFRTGDIRFDPTIREVIQILLKPGQPPLYLISGVPHVGYTKNQLQIVKSNEKLPSNKHQTQFVVEKILDKRKENNRIQYLIKWKGYGSSKNTWEPKTELIKDIPDMIKEFEQIKRTNKK